MTIQFQVNPPKTYIVVKPKSRVQMERGKEIRLGQTPETSMIECLLIKPWSNVSTSLT